MQSRKQIAAGNLQTDKHRNTLNGGLSKVIVFIALLLLVNISALAQAIEKKKALTVARFEHQPVIDGNLNEEEWKQAAIIKDFLQTQPGVNTRPSRSTEVRFGYDANFLYIGIIASDDAEHVRATVAKRDDLSGNDYVSIWLDTFNDARRAYVLLFNPLGVQADAIFTEGQGIDFSFDLVMESKGQVTPEGYTIEVAVPFTSLRYEAGRWGAHVLRVIRHLDEWDTWMPLRRESRDFGTSTFTRFLEQAGSITGIENIGSERTLELIPTLTVSETGRRVRANPAARFDNQPAKIEPGLTAKITISSGITLDAAINPDFAQVEADQLVVTANQRFPIFFEEKRPFFLEGVEIFQTPLKAVHTRTIIDPDVAVKLTGKRGRNTFGLLMASDNAPGNFSPEDRNDPAVRPAIDRFIDKNASVGVLRLKRDIGKESSVGVIATSYNFIENDNQLLGVDGRFTLNPQSVLSFQLLGTTTRRFFYDPALDENVYRTGKGLAYYALLQRNSRHLNLTFLGRGYSPDYVADVGFTSQTNTNPWDLNVSYNSEPKESARMISWTVTSSTRAQFNWQRRMQYAYQAWRSQFNFKRQTYLKADVYTDYQRLFEEEYGPKRTRARQGAFAGASERSTSWQGFTVEAGTAPSKKYSAVILFDRSWKAFDYDLGAGPGFPRVSPAALLDAAAPFDPGPGNTEDINASFNYQPTDALRFSLNYIKSRLVREDTKRVAYDQKIYSFRATYQFTRFTFTRARIDYDTLRANINAQFLLGWSPSPGTAFYAGYNDDLNRNGFNPFSGHYEQGLLRNNRTLFIKMSYLFRRSI